MICRHSLNVVHSQKCGHTIYLLLCVFVCTSNFTHIHQSYPIGTFAPVPVRWSRRIWIMYFADILGKICDHNKAKHKKTKFCVICCMHSCGLVIPYRNRELGQHGNSGLLPDHTKPLPEPTLIARFIGPAWGPSGAERTQVGPMLAPWTLLSGNVALSSARCHGIHLRALSWEDLKISVCKWRLHFLNHIQIP